MANAYSFLHSLTLAVCVISAIGVSLWGRWAMFRLRKLGNGTEAADALMTKIGFAFRSLAYVPLLGLLVFGPPFLCSGADCQPADIASTGLTVSLLLGLLASILWVVFVFGRVYKAGAATLFADLSDRDKLLLPGIVLLALTSVVLMVVGGAT